MISKLSRLLAVSLLGAMFLSGSVAEAKTGVFITPTSPTSSQRPVVTVQTVRNIATEKNIDYFHPKLTTVGIPARLVFKRTQVNSAVDSAGLTVYFGLGGTATSEDYQGFNSQSVYFPPNVYEVEVVVSAVDDTVIEPAGDTMIFTILPDSNIHTPRYNIGKESVAKILIADSNLAAASDMTVNNEKEITVSAGQPVLLEVISNTACDIYGGRFGGDFEAYVRGASIDFQPNQRVKYWSLFVYPTESVEYQIRCWAQLSAPSVDVVRINVL